MLFVGNGNSREGLPEELDSKWVEIAKTSKSVVAEIRNVPNQPLTYLNDGKTPEERYEDNSVAYSWDKFMTTLDPTWSIRLPMVKSVVRAMDTIQLFLERDHDLKISGFVIAGASKRGWVTWLSAAVDKRVVAIITYGD